MGLEVLFKHSVCNSLTVCLVIGVLAGCGDSADPSEAVAAANSNNIQRLANLYLAYQSENHWTGPPDEAKFKDFIQGLSVSALTRIGVDSGKLDEIFVSERDGQPFKIRYKVVGSMMGSSEPVVFEAEGSSGQRMVGFLNMSQREVDSTEYENLWAGKTVMNSHERGK